MDLTVFDKFGLIGGLLLACAFSMWKMANKIYDQMVSDKKEALAEQKAIYDKIIEDSHQREERLMVHTEKQGEMMADIANTLKKIDGEVCNIKQNYYSNREGS